MIGFCDFKLTDAPAAAELCRSAAEAQMTDDTQDQDSPEDAVPPRHARDTATSVFLCNTNRDTGSGSNTLERRMHARNFAAAWTTFNYESHIRRVRGGDLIVMYANGLGVIGVGRALESRLEILGPNHPDRLRSFDGEGENDEEWRVQVKWLVWDEANPCLAGPLRPTFSEITHHTTRVQKVRDHYRGLL